MSKKTSEFDPITSVTYGVVGAVKFTAMTSAGAIAGGLIGGLTGAVVMCGFLSLPMALVAATMSTDSGDTSYVLPAACLGFLVGLPITAPLCLPGLCFGGVIGGMYYFTPDLIADELNGLIEYGVPELVHPIIS